MTYPYREIEQPEPSLPEPKQEQPGVFRSAVLIIALTMAIGWGVLRWLFSTPD